MAPNVGRSKNRYQAKRVPIRATPKLLLYLQDIVEEEGYGTTRPEVARALVWQGIKDLLAAGYIDRRKGPVADGPIEE